ncbi:acyl-CoA/acyl-ACP dehydrogenase [Nocardia sp. 2]|uniref:Acyl-CoA/acyl-ACP dehydrogenase n=2 Tax=Nocardia acididurans TaxID=2802282 RepID=A0ABS1MFH7_9NOCA|nr:acyl-CoA/acyl-ACP dehydrogenase [Nocardia acididurans]
MNFMTRERETTERFLPGLDAKLAAMPLELLESADTPALALFRDAGGTGLLIGAERGGCGANLAEAARVHRALGARSPSLAIAVNMHSCTVAAMPPGPAGDMMLDMVAQARLYLASAFAEGIPGASVITPKLHGERVEGGWKISGSKKPCSLSKSMDILTASVRLRPDGEAADQLALAVIPAASPGIEVRPLPGVAVFPGSETHEVVLTDVAVAEDAISFFGGSDDTLNDALSAAWLTFSVLVSACYLGMASGLVERVLDGRKGTAADRMAMVGDLDTAMAAIEAVANEIAQGAIDPGTVARALHLRFATQRAIERTSGLATELLGGIAFMTGDSAQLYTGCRALAFHPPSRMNIAEPLDRFVAGEPLIVA